MTVCKKCKDAHDRYASGQGFRDFTCAICGKTDVWHNTDVPKICYNCSKRLNICQRCGASLDEKEKKGLE